MLLVEDDDGDALLVEELLSDSGRPVEIVRVATLAEARREWLARSTACCWTSTCPTRRPRGAAPAAGDRGAVAVLVLTGLDDERRGIEAVAAGAQDYLVKGQIDGHGLARAVRYAVERQRADEARQLLEARLHAEENARLERGLLPAPLVGPDRARLRAHYRPAGAGRCSAATSTTPSQAADGSVCA